MTISTYAQLQTAVASWITRDDLTATIPDFITLAESDFNRRIRVRQMMVTQTTTPSSDGQFDLPSDFLSHVKVTWTGSPKVVLEYVHPSQIDRSYPSTPSGTPRCFSIFGTTAAVPTVQIMPTSTTAVDFEYYQKITSLSTDNTANWLLTAAPDLYLAGSLAEAHAFCKSFDQAALWKGRADELISQISYIDRRYRAPSAIRVSGDTITP